MAPSFGRSISFSPLSPARSSSSSKKASSKGAAARHVRSISLPSSRTHPLLDHLQNTIRAVRDWAARPVSASAGLAHIEALQAALAELLLLPEAQQDCAGGGLLDGFLGLADAYGAFQEAVMELKSHAADVQAALRRRDAARLAASVRAQRQAEKDIARLASSMRKLLMPHTHTSELLAEAVSCIASASAAVFSAVEFISSAATTAASSSNKSIIISLVKRTTTSQHNELAALHRLQHFHDSIAEIEAGTAKVFRTIKQNRVALLNIHTHLTC